MDIKGQAAIVTGGASGLGAATARVLYGEKYVALAMRHSITGDPARGGMYVTYGWRQPFFRGRWMGIGAMVAGAPKEAEPGSQEEFITEHYWGYSSLRGGGSVEYQVEHPRWRVWPLQRPVLGEAAGGRL